MGFDESMESVCNLYSDDEPEEAKETLIAEKIQHPYLVEEGEPWCCISQPWRNSTDYDLVVTGSSCKKTDFQHMNEAAYVRPSPARNEDWSFWLFHRSEAHFQRCGLSRHIEWLPANGGTTGKMKNGSDAGLDGSY